ncbi:MAG: hypothetical protein AB3X44_17520 [Leptothrix sp. (in: b-proteobacteria)]
MPAIARPALATDLARLRPHDNAGVWAVAPELDHVAVLSIMVTTPLTARDGAMVQFNTVYLPRIASARLPALALGR